LSLVNFACYQVEVSALADLLSRGVLRSVVCLSVIAKPRQGESMVLQRADVPQGRKTSRGILK